MVPFSNPCMVSIRDKSDSRFWELCRQYKFHNHTELTRVVSIGSLLGFFTNIYQEKIYKLVLGNFGCLYNALNPSHRKYFPVRGPEARLYAACAMGVLFPIGMFIFAWSASQEVPWIILIIGMTVRLPSSLL
jgi:hypothetical protein